LFLKILKDRIQNNYMIKICSGCNEKFECLGNEGCWCNKLDLSEFQLKKLNERCEDCFCEACLKKN